MKGAFLLAAVLVASLAPASLNAQAVPAVGATWSLDTLRSGFCVDFLADPAAAAKGVFRGADPMPAARADSLHPALRRIVGDAPEFASWIPEQFCFYQFAATRVGGAEQRDRKHGRAQAVAVWTMATMPQARKAVVLLVSNARLASSIRRLGLSAEVLRFTFGKVSESTDDRYEIKYDRSVITWSGHASGDSTEARRLDRQWTVAGRFDRLYTVRMQLGASGSRRLAGALRVEGKGELARLLAGSPIRYVGPVVWGSSGEISFLP